MKEKLRQKFNIRWTLLIYDILTFTAVAVFFMVIYKTFIPLKAYEMMLNSFIALICIVVTRFVGDIYRQIWRFGGVECYVRLMNTDAIAFVVYVIIEYALQYLFNFQRISFIRMVALITVNFIVTLAIRMIYRYCFKCGNELSTKGKILRLLLKLFAPGVEVKENNKSHKIYVAIVGAGTAGVSLAEELLTNTSSAYLPRCFFDISDTKVDRMIYGLPVYKEAKTNTYDLLKKHSVKEVILALPETADKKAIYEHYKKSGCKLKTYDYPLLEDATGKRKLREFDIEDLLFRKQITVSNEQASKYYKDKVILITGGGGSIGSELCCQLARLNPKQLIILDIYENGVYDVQQDLKIKYGNSLDLRVEIASITDKTAMSKVFDTYQPDIVINAAAHKHVPLMEHNCIEAVKNNVFGTKTVLELCEEYGTKRFMMVSTDKAVNPTNVMGATKRMCEMIAQGYSTRGTVKCSCTRFGNVLGSAGSVIPLFKRQIAAGGPLTITDKRIIRYFMTIPEASQLVLQSGAMAHNGELFVLDMGQPIKIYDLAQSMIRLSGVQNIEIVETGLRPGEKLYEELLVDNQNLEKTDNNLIFIESEEAFTFEQIEQKLSILNDAVATNDDATVRNALHTVVPTFRTPEEVNPNASDSLEMNIVRKM